MSASSNIVFGNCLEAKNVNVTLAGSEQILFDNLSFSGMLTGTVFIYCVSGTATAVNVYGSADGVHYATLSSALIASVSAGAAGMASFTGKPIKYLRVTATGVAVVDAYISAIAA